MTPPRWCRLPFSATRPYPRRGVYERPGDVRSGECRGRFPHRPAGRVAWVGVGCRFPHRPGSGGGRGIGRGGIHPARTPTHSVSPELPKPLLDPGEVALFQIRQVSRIDTRHTPDAVEQLLVGHRSKPDLAAQRRMEIAKLTFVPRCLG